MDKGGGIEIAIYHSQLFLYRGCRNMKKIVLISFPPEDLIPASSPVSFKVSFNEEIVSVIKATEYLEKPFYYKKVPNIDQVLPPFALREIINLHQFSRKSDLTEISNTAALIAMNRYRLLRDRWPHIRLVMSRKKELVLFSGHHTLLAYMAVGKTMLDEIPYMFIYNEERKFLNDDEMHQFFGKLSKQLRNQDWRDFSISWKTPEFRQLQPRTRRNMGELFDLFKSHISQEDNLALTG
jgi:hypothetical protein